MSTDEECDTNNPLCDRLQINKATCSGVRAKNLGPKQLKQSSRKKNQKQCTRNNSAHPKSPIKDQWIIPGTPSPYFLGSKKRQNGDKAEQTAHPKRTCLSDRFSITSQNRGRKKKYLFDVSSFPQPGGDSKQSSVKNDEFNPLENHSRMELNGSFESISADGACKCPSATIGDMADVETPSSSSHSSCCSNNQNYSFNKTETLSSSLDDSLARPSTSKCGPDGYKQKNSKSLCKLKKPLGVNFIDTDSDDSGMHLNGSLNGSQSRYDHFRPVRKVIGKGLRKVLESDDEEDDDDDDDDSEDACWPNRYRRGVPLISSDSDDSSVLPVTPKKVFKKRNLSQLSSTDSNDGSSSSWVAYSPPHTRTSTLSKKSSSERSSDCSNMRDHSYATRQSASESNNSSSLSSSTSLSSQSNTSSSSADRNTRYSCQEPSLRRTTSPLLRITRSRRQSGLSRSAMSHIGNIQHPHNRPLDFATRYPEIFDPEESSDMEFFTANSYSDNEASISNIDCFAGGDGNSTVSSRNCHNNQTYSISGSSPSEDEISVIFTRGTAFPETSNRRIRHRGIGGRRRRARGSGRSGVLNNQDVVSVSPDPVEQVRQMEEDERFARMLQAQFDAEVNDRSEVADSHNSTESDNESVPPSHFQTVSFPPPSRPTPIVTAHHVRGFSRMPIPSNIMFLSGGRRRRGRRSIPIQGDPWMFQFARILGLSPAYTSPEESDHETLLQYAESVGDVPRGLHKTEINRLPTRKFYLPGFGPSTSQGHEDIVHKRTELNKECQVCLSDYENGDLLRILPCFHEFHTPCIDPWLKINHTCPVCRVEVVLD